MDSIRKEDIIETINMLSEQRLNIRTVTLGISLLDCVTNDTDTTIELVQTKLLKGAGNFVNTCKTMEKKYGVPIINKRITVTPISFLLEPLVTRVGSKRATDDAIKLAKSLDKCASEVGVDLIGGYSALVQKGITNGAQALIESLPEALSSTVHVCSSVAVADSKSGINVNAIINIGKVIKRLSEVTDKGFGNAKLVTLSNPPIDNPFMAGGFHGIGEEEMTINVGISGPGVIKSVVHKSHGVDMMTLAENIKRAAFKITRVGELIGRETSKSMHVKFGAVDLSLAPSPNPNESVAEIIEEMGIGSTGMHGSTAAIALLTDAIKKGGVMGASSVGGLSGAFIPLSEDLGMMQAITKGSITLDKLEAMTAVCSTGIDMVAIPGDTTSDEISAIILDEMAIGVYTNKSTGVRVLPIPGQKAGEKVDFGGLFGRSQIIPVKKFTVSEFVQRGGRIPPPITSLRN